MKRALTAIGLTGLIAAGAMALPSAASAQSVNGAARAYCNVERQDRQDFIRDYGSAGKKGMKRCIRREIALGQARMPRGTP